MPSFRRVRRGARATAWVNERAPGARTGRRAGRRRAAGAAPGRGAAARRPEAADGAGGAPVLRLAGRRAASRPRRRGAGRAGRGRAGRGLRSRMGRLRAGAEVPPADPRRAVPAPGPARPAPMRPTPGTWACARSTPWRPVGSTTTSSAGSAATRPTPTGWSPTSRRCSPTRPSWPGPTCTRGRTAGGRDYLGVVTETLDFVLRDLSTPEGALYSSFDADAGGVEGAHATFTARRAAPDPPRRHSSGRRPSGTGSPPGGNWEGRSIPVRPVGAPLERPPEVEEARVLLAAARAQRVQPARDEKVLTEWNAMTVATLAEVAVGDRAGRLRAAGRGDRRVPLGVHVRRRPPHAQLAGRAGAPPGRGGRLRVAGRGLLPAVGVDGPGAVAGAGGAARSTSCSTCSGTTCRAASSPPGSDAEALVVRPKEFLDGAVPAANSVAVAALLHAGRLRRRPADGRGASSAPWAWPARCSNGTRARWPTWWRRCPCGTAATRSSSPGDRPDLLAEVRRALAPGRRRRLGRARRRPALRRASGRARTGLRLPGARLPDARGGRRHPGRPIGSTDRMSGRSIRRRTTPRDGAKAPAATRHGDRCDRGTSHRRRARERRDRATAGTGRRLLPTRPPTATDPTRCSGARPAARSGSRPRAARPCTSSSCPRRSRTPPSSTWRRARSCGSACPGPRGTNPTSAPSTWWR